MNPDFPNMGQKYRIKSDMWKKTKGQGAIRGLFVRQGYIITILQTAALISTWS